MQQQELERLFRTYCSGKMESSEFLKFKSAVQSADDETLTQLLATEWTTFDASFLPPPVVKRTASAPPRKQKFPAVFMLRAAAVLLPLLLMFSLYILHQNQKYTKLASQTFRAVAGKGERSSLFLPDGTQVSLNSSSSLTFSPSENGNRVVWLSGEAYFEVAHLPDRPFIVKTDVANIKVLGTVFNVRANPGDDFFEASLVSGRVEVNFNQQENRTITLNPNQKVRLDKKEGKWQLNATDLWVETAWKRGDLAFRSQTMQEVLTHLGQFYGTEIHLSGKYPSELFTGSFHEQEIYPVLKNLQKHYRFSFTKSGNDVFIKF